MRKKSTTIYKLAYRRMSPDEPASTITTASGHIGSDRTLHPWENRVLSPAECAHLQTFPSDFKWGNAIDRWGHSPVRQMIGEAVPPLFTQMHGDILASLYHEKDSSMAMDSDDPHCLPPIQ
ncbi:MAG: DNA cytosine methyltransferase [Bacteroidetes bacterium]|nr:DNA cytosine methyltransferase [Bacteroidota bacterium]